MELVSLGKELLQSAAEFAASYRVGQVVLRQLDRALWVVEKTAKWAVPPPLDADERPQGELVRPLAWPLFLMLLLTLRMTREAVSLFNLVAGKPPLRSADVVVYIQSRRRYLRTLKYQGSRVLRARSTRRGSWGSWGSWGTSARGLLQLSMCFARPHCNNNTTLTSHNDEVMVVGADSMDRLLERMMLDADAGSDDSSYTLTNATSGKSDSEMSESDHDTRTHGDVTTPSSADQTIASSTPKEEHSPSVLINTSNDENPSTNENTPNGKHTPNNKQEFNDINTTSEYNTPMSHESTPKKNESLNTESADNAEKFLFEPKEKTETVPLPTDSETFVRNERTQKYASPKKAQKLANGRTIENSQIKKRDGGRLHRNN